MARRMIEVSFKVNDNKYVIEFFDFSGFSGVADFYRRMSKIKKANGYMGWTFVRPYPDLAPFKHTNDN